MNWIDDASIESYDVMCQYDIKTSDNQCSWCTYKNISNYKIFHNIDRNLDKYNKLLQEASEEKNQHSKLICGENIDSELLIKHYSENIRILGYRYIETGIEYKNELLSILPEPLKTTFFVPKGSFFNIDELKRCVYEFLPYPGRFMAVNRFGQSFACIGLSGNRIAIADSHCKKVAISNPEKVFNYINVKNDGYNIISFTFGYTI